MKKLLLTLLIISCSEPQGVYIDDRLEEHYETFLYEAKKRNVRLDVSGLTMKIGKARNGWAGQTNIDKREVIIDWDWYRGADGNKPVHYQVEAMVAHELGHCLLGIIEHSDSISLIMPMPYFQHEYVYIETREWLWDDLFSRRK